MKQLILGLACAGLAVPTYATAVFTLGNVPQPGEENVLLATNQTGTTVTGETNQSHTVIDFVSTTDTLTTPAVGQAMINAVDGLINNVTISVASGLPFNDLIFNPAESPPVTVGVPATVTAHMSDGTAATFSYVGGLGPGNNFLTITTSGGELISSVTIDSGGFPVLKQVRISGIGGVTIPEPSSLALMSGGLLVIPLLRRRRRQ